MGERKFNFATWLRVAGMISILLCHYVQKSQSTVLGISAQFFNIGVDIFIILSGFLFGTRNGGAIDAKTWYKKRLKRIFVPYEIFVILLLIIHSIRGMDLLDMDLIWLALGLQGSVVGVLGAEQTWFISSLLICYAITPLLSRFFGQERRMVEIFAFLAVAVFAPLLWAIPKNPAFNTLLSPLSCYAIAFAIGCGFDRIPLTKGKVVIAFFAMTAAFAVRIIGRYYCDGTVLYERIICGYTQSIAAFCIFYMFAVAFERVTPTRVIQMISDISFEIYLVHYMFCVGPVSLFGVTPYWTVSSVIVTALSAVLGITIHKISEAIIKRSR